MYAHASILARRLAGITARFFETKLALTPRKVSVQEEWSGDFVVIRVEGFMSRAEAALSKRLQGDKILDEYYTRLLEQLIPMFSAVVAEVAKRPLLECRPALDLPRDECRFLLTLGAKEPKRVSAHTQEAKGKDGEPGG